MNIGFIGSGNMGSAIIGGIINAEIAKPQSIYVSDLNKEALEKIKDNYGVSTEKSNIDAVKKSDVIFLCVKPNVVMDVVLDIHEFVDESKLIISIAAGTGIEKLEGGFGKNTRIIRVMPNTPALVGEGMSAICANEAGEQDIATALSIFSSFGKAIKVSEKQMDIVTAISGSSPAYVFMLIEAMADAGVRGGLKRADAYIMASQAVLGSAKMVLDTGRHPGDLKDMVCSPSGTTIDAVAVLEEEGFRASIIKAMKACEEKSKSF